MPAKTLMPQSGAAIPAKVTQVKTAPPSPAIPVTEFRPRVDFHGFHTTEDQRLSLDDKKQVLLTHLAGVTNHYQLVREIVEGDQRISGIDQLRSLAGDQRYDSFGAKVQTLAHSLRQIRTHLPQAAALLEDEQRQIKDACLRGLEDAAAAGHAQGVIDYLAFYNSEVLTPIGQPEDREVLERVFSSAQKHLLTASRAESQSSVTGWAKIMTLLHDMGTALPEPTFERARLTLVAG